MRLTWRHPHTPLPTAPRSHPLSGLLHRLCCSRLAGLGEGWHVPSLVTSCCASRKHRQRVDQRPQRHRVICVWDVRGIVRLRVDYDTDSVYRETESERPSPCGVCMGVCGVVGRAVYAAAAALLYTPAIRRAASPQYALDHHILNLPLALQPDETRGWDIPDIPRLVFASKEHNAHLPHSTR